MINALITALNESTKLPRLLLMIPEADFLHQINIINSGKSPIIGKCFEYLVSNVEKAIQRKKEELRHKKPGAVMANKPKILWLTLIHRQGYVDAAYQAAVKACNAIMEEVLSTKRNHFILKLDNFLEEIPYFTSNNDLTGTGKVKFWRSINKVVEGFDKYEVSLRPISQAEKELMEKRKAEREQQQQQQNTRGNGRFFRGNRRGQFPRRGCGQGRNSSIHI